jgi:hypothetical protein
VHPSFCGLSATHFIFTADHLTIFVKQQHVREALFPKLLPLRRTKFAGLHDEKNARSVVKEHAGEG